MARNAERFVPPAPSLLVEPSMTPLHTHTHTPSLHTHCALHVRCRVLDTTILYPHPSGPPARCALRVLASKYLRRTIQQGAHDSAVDARAALDLVALKIRNGGPPPPGGKGAGWQGTLTAAC
jgi:hypothetical protein